jgi:hypothetical protein
MLLAMDPFATPTPADRDRLADDLRERAEQVRRDGWEPYAAVWSGGQVAAVRVALGDHASTPEACSALAGSLFGIQGAEADAADGYPRTFAWLMDVGRG